MNILFYCSCGAQTIGKLEPKNAYTNRDNMDELYILCQFCGHKLGHIVTSPTIVDEKTGDKCFPYEEYKK